MSRELPDHDRDEPPFVAALLLRAVRLTGRAFRAVTGIFSPMTWMLLWAFGTVAGAIMMFFVGHARADGAPPVVVGIIAALVFAFFSAFIGVMFFMAVLSRPQVAPDVDSRAADLDRELEPTLAMLRTVRADIIREVKARSLVRVPLCMAAGVAIWAYGASTGDPDAPGLLPLLLIGALGGEVWASHRLAARYRQLYKDSVLPLLAARHGDLTYRKADAAAVRRLVTFGLMRERGGAVTAEDAIVGTHRGLALSITEVTVVKGSGDDRETLFDGLLVALTLPRSMTGTTVIAPDRGRLGNLAEGRRLQGLQRVRLEDPRFERRFEVYASDQIEARALLTPAFMERFTTLAGDEAFDLPGGWAHGSQLVIALPKLSERRLFEPPAWWERAGGRALVRLSDEIAAVVAMADVVIHLDFWASGRAASHTASPRDAGDTTPLPAVPAAAQPAAPPVPAGGPPAPPAAS